MISFIKGTTVSIEDGIAVVDNNGIGYEILVTNNTLSNLKIGKEVKLNIYMQVREDAFVLYGFESSEEKRMFLNLITVSGVGCKVAISVLSGMQYTDLAVCIANNDAASLSKIKGIGKKTAERIVLELKEKISAQGISVVNTTESIYNLSIGSSGDEALFALAALGLNKTECLNAVKMAINNGAKSTEEIITSVLKGMVK